MGRLHPVTPLALVLAALLMSQSAWAQPAPNIRSNDDAEGISDQQLTDYANLANQGLDALQRGETNLAVRLLEQARRLAPESSLAAVANNLAAAYIKRGNQAHNQGRGDEAALSDFRKAAYQLAYSLPRGVHNENLLKDNLSVAQNNVRIAWQNLRISPTDAQAHLKLARTLRLQGRFDEAVVEFAHVLSLDAKNAEAPRALGDLLTVLNQPDRAKGFYQQAVANTTDEAAKAALLVQLGNAQNKSGELEAAVATLNQALEANPNDRAALKQLEDIWRREVKFNPQSAAAMGNLAGVLQKQQRYADAIQAYQQADTLANRDPSVPLPIKKLIRINMGTLYQQMTNYAQALRVYDSVLQVDAKDTQARYLKATLYRDANRQDDAIQLYYQVLAIDPNHVPSRTDLLAIFSKETDPARRLQGMKAFADRFPQEASVQAAVGEALHQLKDYPHAAEYYQRAIRANPRLASAHANLGAVYQAMNRPAEAKAAFQKAMQLEPNNAQLRQVAQASIASAEASAGADAYAQAIARQQDGDVAGALPLFQQALTASPGNRDYRTAYAVALQGNQQLPEAIAQYRQVLADKALVGADRAQVVYGLGTALHQRQEWTEARKAYQESLALKPDFAEAKEALASVGQAQAAQLLERAMTAYNGQRYAEGLSLTDQALALDGKNATAHYYKGLMLTAQQKPLAAAESYRRATAADPAFKDAFYSLGVALDAQKQPADALKAFQKFLELAGQDADTDPELVAYARQRVGAQASR